MGLNFKVKTLFTNVLYNGTITKVDTDHKRLTFKIGKSEVSIEFHKMCKNEDKEVVLQPLGMEQVRGLSFADVWSLHTPINSNLPLYTFYLITKFRSYRVPDITLGDQEKFVEQINKILADYEDAQLDILITESFE